MSTPEMGVLEFATPKEAWGGEATAFTPALATRLDYLGEACGLGPLELQGTEVKSGARRIDVLAAAEQRHVVIENQYGSSDHDHLTRGLAYAVAEGASALVVVAERHGGEFIAVADYLNNLAEQAGHEAVAVWLVEVKAVRRTGDAIWSPLFNVVSQPNAWEQAVKSSAVSHGITDPGPIIEATANPAEAAWLLETWLAEVHTSAAVGGDVNPTVQLRHPDPADARQGHAFITIQGPRVWVNVGFLHRASGAFATDASRELLTAMLHDAVPAAAGKHSTMPAYLTVEYSEVGARRKEVADFIVWLLEHLDREIGISAATPPSQSTRAVR